MSDSESTSKYSFPKLIRGRSMFPHSVSSRSSFRPKFIKSETREHAIDRFGRKPRSSFNKSRSRSPKEFSCKDKRRPPRHSSNSRSRSRSSTRSRSHSRRRSRSHSRRRSRSHSRRRSRSSHSRSRSRSPRKFHSKDKRRHYKRHSSSSRSRSRSPSRSRFQSSTNFKSRFRGKPRSLFSTNFKSQFRGKSRSVFSTNFKSRSQARSTSQFSPSYKSQSLQADSTSLFSPSSKSQPLQADSASQFLANNKFPFKPGSQQIISFEAYVRSLQPGHIESRSKWAIIKEWRKTLKTLPCDPNSPLQPCSPKSFRVVSDDNLDDKSTVKSEQLIKLTCTSRKNIDAVKRFLENDEKLNELKGGKIEVEVVSLNEIVKVRVVLLLSYIGKDIFGYKIRKGRWNNCASKIENQLLAALLNADIITVKEFTEPKLVNFRTGVFTDNISAARNFVALEIPAKEMLATGPQKINSYLPPDIKVHAFKKVPMDFDPRNLATYISYSYMLPTFAFAPTVVQCTEEYRIEENRMQEVKEFLKDFVKDWNRSQKLRMSTTDEKIYKNYVKAFDCSSAFELYGIQFCILKINFQLRDGIVGFLRELVALAVAVLRRLTTVKECYVERKVEIPQAPELCVLLEEPHFISYNKKYSADSVFEPLLWNGYMESVEQFKWRQIYLKIAKAEKDVKVTLLWLNKLYLDSLKDKTTGDQPMVLPFNPKEVNPVTLPAKAEEMILPANAEEMTLPANVGEMTLPANVEEMALPTNAEELILPAKSAETTLPLKPEKITSPSDPKKSGFKSFSIVPKKNPIKPRKPNMIPELQSVQDIGSNLDYVFNTKIQSELNSKLETSMNFNNPQTKQEIGTDSESEAEMDYSFYFNFPKIKWERMTGPVREDDENFLRDLMIKPISEEPEF